MPQLPKLESLQSPVASDQRQTEIQFNASINDDAQYGYASWGDAILSWQTAVASNLGALGRGSTDTNLGSGQFLYSINGVQAQKAAVAAGTAFGALGTVPLNTWAVIAVDIASGGTISFLSGAANYTTGYATEAAAIAAVPSRVAAKARVGYVTILTKVGSAFVVGTDALAGGASGNPATTTNFYAFMGQAAPTGTPTNCSLSGGMGSLWTAGANGVVIGTTLSRGSTDTNLATTAFTFNAGQICNLAKAAVAAGTAFGALGTIPAGKWGAIIMLIDAGGTIAYLSAPDNYGSGYADEASAQRALYLVTPTANKCMVGYITVKTKDASTAWIAGTDALAGGASGNPASVTNFYPTPGFTPVAGISAAQIASRTGTVLTSVNY